MLFPVEVSSGCFSSVAQKPSTASQIHLGPLGCTRCPGNGRPPLVRIAGLPAPTQNTAPAYSHYPHPPAHPRLPRNPPKYTIIPTRLPEGSLTETPQHVRNLTRRFLFFLFFLSFPSSFSGGLRR